MLSKFPLLVKRHQSEIVLAGVVIIISVLSFQLGKIYAWEKWSEQPFPITERGMVSEATATEKSSTASGQTLITTVVASKNSSLYHFPWCPGAGRISAKNKITFPNEAAAIAAGLTLASNCSK